MLVQPKPFPLAPPRSVLGDSSVESRDFVIPDSFQISRCGDAERLWRLFSTLSQVLVASVSACRDTHFMTHSLVSVVVSVGFAIRRSLAPGRATLQRPKPYEDKRVFTFSHLGAIRRMCARKD